MRMPEKCPDCNFESEHGFCLAKSPDFCGYTDELVRPDWCPLVDLGKHGDLIDADELKKEFPKDTDWEYPVNTNEYVCEMIDKAKTVIEAEGE
jgi:hypothetical protein